jgi:hypothetical protein
MRAAPQMMDGDRAVDASDFEGRWAFCDDGWLGSLTLRSSDDGQLEGEYYSERFKTSHAVSAQLDATTPGLIDLWIHDFNWLDRQHFRGRLCLHGRNAFAGTTMWHDEPYGFFARRGARIVIGSLRDGTARGDDFAGSWNVSIDGVAGDMVLEYDAAEDVVRGVHTRRADGDRHTVVGRPGREVKYRIDMELGADDGTADAPVVTLRGYLMSRPKSGICGWATRDDEQFGFYMLRYR